METLSPDNLNKIKARINSGTANIYDILTCLDFKIIDFPELHRPKDAKIFSPFRSPILDAGDERNYYVIIETLLNQYTEGKLKDLDGHLQFIDAVNRCITKQEILKYYHLALKYLEDDCEIKPHCTPFDIVSLQEGKEMMNFIIVMNLILDNFCEIIDRLKFSNSIDNIDTSKLNLLFNQYIEIKENSNNIDRIEILKKIRNCIRHNDYELHLNTINIKTNSLEIDIKNSFFDNFNQAFIEDAENSINSNQQNSFFGINWKEGFENNKDMIINNINQIYQTYVTPEQIIIMEDFFKNYKFTENSLKFCIKTIGLDSIKEKFVFRRVMIDLISYLMGVKNYDLNTIETSIFRDNKIPENMINDLIRYIKIQCIKFYYINKSDLDTNNEGERHLRNCFTHGRYTDSFTINKIAICDRNIHRIDPTTGKPIITYQNIFNIDDLYSKIETEGGFSNLSDIIGDSTLKGFVVGNFIEDKAGELKAQFRYMLYDNNEGKYKETYFGGKIESHYDET